MEVEDMQDNAIASVSPASLNRLGKIVTDLRKKVPVSAEAPGEQIAIPKTEEVSTLMVKYHGFCSSLTCYIKKT
jgi:hypothetical protein